MKRLGIYGGTFSPPHLGHIRAAEAFVRAAELDELIIMPTHLPPHKSIDGEATAHQRFEMCECAFSGVEKTAVSDYEINKGGKSYTYLTLLDHKSDGVELFFLVGTDMFLTLDSWVRPDEIFKSATVALVRRENDQNIDSEILAKKSLYEHSFGARIMLTNTRVTEISSSDIRDAIKSGSDTSEYLSKETAAYIKKEGLYGASYTESDLSDLRERVKGMLGEKRFSHTLGVERAASRLARVLIPEREAEARAAAILHDAAKELSRDEQRALLSDTEGLTQEDLSSEKLYHAFCAPALIKRDFPEFAKDSILSAVFRHTSGDSDMSVLDLVIFVADFIEDDREYRACRELREKLYRALDEGADPERALKRAALDELIFTESYLNSRGERLNSRSNRAIDYLKNELKQ